MITTDRIFFITDINQKRKNLTQTLLKELVFIKTVFVSFLVQRTILNKNEIGFLFVNLLVLSFFLLICASDWVF